MNNELEFSLKAAQKEFREEPMKDFYHNKFAGWPSRLRVKKVLEELGEVRNKRVLDIGCEAGFISFKILDKKPSELYSIDIVEEALNEFKEKLKKRNYKVKIVIKKAFLQKMPFKNGFFDSAVCTEVIEHAPEIEKGFKEMARVLKGGGKLVLTFPNEKLRKKVYWIAKLFGINTDVEKDVTLFDYNPKDLIKKLREDFIIKKFYRLPFFFPITHFIVCEKK